MQLLFSESVGHPMTKMLSVSGGLRPPDPLTRGSAPGSRWGLCPQTPVIGSRSALAIVPPEPLTLPPPMALPWKKSYGRPWYVLFHLVVVCWRVRH